MPIALKPAKEVKINEWTKGASRAPKTAKKKERSATAGIPVMLRVPPDLLEQIDATREQMRIDRTAYILTAARRELKLLKSQKARDEFKLDIV